MSAEGSKVKKGLGRGLSALLGDDVRVDAQAVAAADGADPASGEGPHFLSIELIVANPDQPRRRFDEDALRELADSIREKGVIQPILVRPLESDPGLYEIVAGERRWRAAQRAQLHKVPVVVRSLNDEDVLEIALIENIQRQDLSPVEEARAYQKLIDERGHSHEALGQIIGKSRSHVANMLRLLGLPERVLGLLDEGRISMGHARALITAADPVKLAQLVAEKGLSVRETEALASQSKTSAPGGAKRAGTHKDPDIRALENDLSQTLGLKVGIAHKGKGGQLLISYGTLDQLDELCQRLCQTPGAKGPAIRGF